MAGLARGQLWLCGRLRGVAVIHSTHRRCVRYVRQQQMGDEAAQLINGPL